MNTPIPKSLRLAVVIAAGALVMIVIELAWILLLGLAMAARALLGW